jgi:hypothetical protein
MPVGIRILRTTGERARLLGAADVESVFRRGLMPAVDRRRRFTRVAEDFSSRGAGSRVDHAGVVTPKNGVPY